MNAPQLLSVHPYLRAAAPFAEIVASVGACAHVSADLAQIDALRRSPGDLQDRDLPASFLKHADEQSVCGFAAVLQAICKHGSKIADFRDWGVVGAPRFPGRLHGGGSIVRFFDQGVRGISPHAIPQNSLHSLSGVISVGLGMGGANLGAGGGAQALAEGLMTALTTLAEGRLPGLWLVATQWDREPLPQKNGKAVVEGKCHAVAMALSAGQSAGEELCLRMRPDDAAPAEPEKSGPRDGFPSAIELAEALERRRQARRGSVIWSLDLHWGAQVALVKK